ncbi:MAG TPA: glycosyltransferase family 39 protein [Puia sp.]|nr:glycosyltransferase family 39 protein [Puia sp.]
MIEPNHAEWKDYLQKWFIPLLIPAILVNAGGLLIPILEPDGSLYATIAKTIARTGDFVNLFVDGKDWLDKPHFPFWMAALSFRFLGVNAFAYKFPALLFWAAGAFYTWRLALSLYGKPVAQLSVLIYVSAAHLVISNNDVRAEPYLTGLIIGSVYHFYKASRSPLGLHLVAGSLLAACACMTKGPFVLITIGAGFVIDWIWSREWNQFRNIRWWLAIVLTAVFTLPELICLYLQFDRHPSKIVFGHSGVSGIRFFFWDSQFGRFFNTGPIKGSGDPFFYFHTVLWAFLPWSLLLYAAIVRKLRKGTDATASALPHRHIPGDKICLGGALATFLVFSLSRFQLPHYLNILFPFFSILTAGYLYNIHRRGARKAVRITQDSINILLPVLLLLLCWLFQGWSWVMAVLVVLAILPFYLFRDHSVPASIARSFWMSMLVFAFINFILYPGILRYQAGTQAGRYLETHPTLSPSAYLLGEAPVSYSFEFDCPMAVNRVPIDSLPKTAVVFTPLSYGDTLTARGFNISVIQHFDYFHVSQLTGEFVNYRTRSTVLTPWALFRVTR